MEEDAFNATGIQKGGATFQSYGAVAVGIAAVVAMIVIGGVTISYTFIISLAFFIVSAAFIYLYFHQQKKAAKLEKQRKDDAWKQIDSDKIEVEKFMSDTKDQFSAEISSIENDWPVQTQTTNKLKNELNKLYNEIDALSLKILSEASEHKKKMYTCNSGEWSHVMSFRKIQEDVLKQCKTKKSDITTLKKKFKLTDSAVLAEVTRQTAEQIGNVLPSKSNELKLYKLPLQMTNAHQKIRRFELGVDTGKDHRYLRKLFYMIIFLFFVRHVFLFLF